MNLPRLASYLAYKQHLLPASRLDDVAQVTRDIVALHATSPTGPYLSLWARVPEFRRESLENALYDRRDLVRMLCMRTTLHVVPTGELALFFQACQDALARPRDEALQVLAGLYPEEPAGAMLPVHQQVLGEE